MSGEPVFLNILGCKGVISTDVVLLQLSAIGAVKRCIKVTDTTVIYEIAIRAPRDMEGFEYIAFETEALRDEFLKNLISMLSRKATLVTV